MDPEVWFINKWSHEAYPATNARKPNEGDLAFVPKQEFDLIYQTLKTCLAALGYPDLELKQGGLSGEHFRDGAFVSKASRRSVET